MKLYRQDSKEYSDGSKRNVYKFETLNTSDELKNFMNLIQNQYGKIYDIIVKKYQSQNEVLVYGRYSNLDEFIKNFNIDIKEFNIYEFLGKNMHYKIDTLKNIVDIYQDNYISDEQSETPDYEYYRFESGLIVRFNKVNAHCDYLDNNNWVSKNSLITLIDDAAYKYEIIDNPLDIKKQNSIENEVKKK